MVKYEDFLKKNECKAILSSINYSQDIIKKLTDDLLRVLGEDSGKKYTIVITGSFGRNEASNKSDLDIFLFCDKEEDITHVESEVKGIEECIKKYVVEDTGDTGTFGTDKIVSFASLLENIGGKDDLNQLLTRRILFLLEGRSIYNRALFEKYRKELIEKYLQPTSDDDSKIDKYLLNDIIRYYRTVTTDFQHKIDSGGKSWGLRNIKLKFSRKFLYFAGIAAVGCASSDESPEYDKRVRSLLLSLGTDPLQRIFNVCQTKLAGKDSSTLNDIFSDYNYFLERISDEGKRKSLEMIKKKEDRRGSELYLELSNKSMDFTVNLHKLLKSLFDESHAIHLALIF